MMDGAKCLCFFLLCIMRVCMLRPPTPSRGPRPPPSSLNLSVSPEESLPPPPLTKRGTQPSL
uniref:Uncharacterized protein n=1 Tax=Anguilla anguilla TaxID=7936 RepID=A0A0E9WXH5_ANGAN